METKLGTFSQVNNKLSFLGVFETGAMELRANLAFK